MIDLWFAQSAIKNSKGDRIKSIVPHSAKGRQKEKGGLQENGCTSQWRTGFLEENENNMGNILKIFGMKIRGYFPYV